jgi:exosortase
MVANGQVMRALLGFSQADPSASHLVLIPFVTLALILRRRDAIFSSSGTDWRAGVLVIVAGLFSLFVPSLSGQTGGQTDLLAAKVAALVTLWLGGFLLFYGRTAFQAALFPLLFLTCMIPIPSAVLDGAIHILTVGSGWVVASLFTLTGTPYYREGFVFDLPNVAIEIAKECSGIRSTIGLVLTSLIAGHLYLTSGWARVLLVAASVLITILKNGIRIVSLALLTLHVDPTYLDGQLHHDGGPVFFVLALTFLTPVLALLRRSEARRKYVTVAARAAA